MRETRSLFRNLMCWTWIASGIAIPGMLNRAAAQVVTPTQVQVIGPAMANPGRALRVGYGGWQGDEFGEGERISRSAGAQPVPRVAPRYRRPLICFPGWSPAAA